MIATLLLVCAPLASPADDPERRQPAADARAHQPFAWTSEGGLRYVWWLPEDYDGERPTNLTVILHGTGLDYRWGLWNNPPGTFRPNDVVVSVDGPTPNGESRLFMGNEKDADAVHAFLEEMRATFAVERVFLYGHSQGGFFVVYYAGEHPEDVTGVVAHASGAWSWSKTGKPVRKVAIAFLHGSADPVVPYRQSPASRDAYADEGFELLHLRRMDGYNHWPNAVRATETLDWCQGMTATDPEEVLGLAREILRPKGSDPYQYETPPGFAGACDLLRRVLGEGPAPLARASDAERGRARKMLAALDEHAERHVAELRRALKAKKDLSLDKGKAGWLGHLVQLREDFRGVAPVEALAVELGYDRLARSHAKAAEGVLRAWYAEKPPAAIYAETVGAIDGAFLFDGFPPELAARMEEWHGAGRELGIAAKDRKRFDAFEAWSAGWKEGREAYRRLWRDWKGAPGR
jgi:predicted esterase